MLEHFENFPPEGAEFVFNGHPMTVLAVEGKRVQQVRIEPAVPDENEEESGSAVAAGNG